MGIRGELYSTTVALKNRTYFFNVKENRVGDLYLNIVESKNKDEGGFERQSVILFADDLQEFLKGFDESLKVMEKSVREKQKAAPREGRSRPPRSGEGFGDRPDHGDRSDRGGFKPGDRGDRGGFKPADRGDRPGFRPGDREDGGSRKRFVKKPATGFRNDRPFGGKSFGEGGERPAFNRDGGHAGFKKEGFKKEGFKKEGFAAKSGHSHDGGWKSAGASGIKKPPRKTRVVRAVPHHNQD